MGDREDNELLDNWEHLEESGELDRRLEKMKLAKEELENGTSSTKPEPLILSPEDIRLKCLPPEPSVKILQRPTANGLRNGIVNGEGKPKQPLKSLQQREQEYAEARLRILGEARSPEEDIQFTPQLDDRIQKIQSKTEILRSGDSCAGILRLPKGPDGTSGFNLRR